MNNRIKPIFLISLPRSGSTLLQKILMGHSDIASHAEPWFLLPFVYGTRKEGIKTEYGQKSATVALEYLKKSLGEEGFYESEIGDLALRIYKKLSLGRKYFLDKTPRYFYILEDLIGMFPNARFIILLRNPLGIFASNIEAFKNNSIKRIDYLENDFYLGPRKISEFVNKYLNSNKKIHLLTYHELINDTYKCIKEICDFLGIDFEYTMLNNFTNQVLNGYGDHIGSKMYKTVQDNTQKWKKIINTYLKKRLLINYIYTYDEGYLKLMGLNKSDIVDEIKKHKVKKINIKEIYYYAEYICVKKLKKFLNYKSMS